MITTKAEGLFANEPERRGVTSLACHVSARGWSVHGGPGAGVGCPVHGGPGLVRGGGGAAWPRRRLHGRSGRARHSGPRGLGEPRKAHGRGWRLDANAARASAAAGDDRSDGVTWRRRRATPARPFARKVERESAGRARAWSSPRCGVRAVVFVAGDGEETKIDDGGTSAPRLWRRQGRGWGLGRRGSFPRVPRGGAGL